MRSCLLDAAVLNIHAEAREGAAIGSCVVPSRLPAAAIFIGRVPVLFRSFVFSGKSGLSLRTFRDKMQDWEFLAQHTPAHIPPAPCNCVLKTKGKLVPGTLPPGFFTAPCAAHFSQYPPSAMEPHHFSSHQISGPRRHFRAPCLIIRSCPKPPVVRHIPSKKFFKTP